MLLENDSRYWQVWAEQLTYLDPIIQYATFGLAIKSNKKPVRMRSSKRQHVSQNNAFFNSISYARIQQMQLKLEYPLTYRP